MIRARRGVALLEVLVALTMVAVVGAATIGHYGAAVAAVRHVEEEERLIDEAQRILVQAVLLDRRDLDRRMGAYQEGRIVRSIDRPARGLYRVAVSSSGRTGRPLLVTVVYRRGNDR